MDEDLLERLDKAVFRGNGKDSLMARMLVVETRLNEQTKWMKSLDRKLSSAVLGIGCVLLTLLGEIIVKGIWH